MKNEKDVIGKAIDQLLSDTESDTLIKNSLRCLIPSLRRGIFLAMAFSISLITYLTYFTTLNNDAIANFLELIKSVNEIALPILGLAVTGYAIFQALVNGDTLITLLKISEKEKSKFQEYNYFFLAFSILYTIIIISNFCIALFLRNVSLDWHIAYFSVKVNNAIYSIVVSAYITIVLNALIEIKSFVYNLYQIFSTNAAAKGISYLNNKNE